MTRGCPTWAFRRRWSHCQVLGHWGMGEGVKGILSFFLSPFFLSSSVSWFFPLTESTRSRKTRVWVMQSVVVNLVGHRAVWRMVGYRFRRANGRYPAKPLLCLYVFYLHFLFLFSASTCLCELCWVLYLETAFGTNFKQIESP